MCVHMCMCVRTPAHVHAHIVVLANIHACDAIGFNCC